MIKLLFVCMGNICRSPLAQGAFEALIEKRGLEDKFLIDSAGTISYHSGEAPDPRSIKVARDRGIDISNQRARLVHRDDMTDFDYILTMDRNNISALKVIACVEEHEDLPNVSLFLDYCDHMPLKEIPDPFRGHERDFVDVLRVCEDASESLLAHIEKTHDLS